jgi:hypothetical protein
MKVQLTPFERYMRNQLRKERAEQRDKILDEMLQDLKAKHQQERDEKIQKLENELKELTK